MVSDILSGITRMLKERYPDHTVYRNPKDAGARLPCFFVTAPLGAQKQRLYDVMEEEPTIQIVRLPSGRAKTPTEENRRIAGELLRELREGLSPPITGPGKRTGSTAPSSSRFG